MSQWLKTYWWWKAPSVEALKLGKALKPHERTGKFLLRSRAQLRLVPFERNQSWYLGIGNRSAKTHPTIVKEGRTDQYQGFFPVLLKSFRGII
jgi:hypothetical protein